MAKILIVEDEDMLASTLRGILTRAGHTVDTAPNGRTGLNQFIGSTAYDLVITDLIMPEADGIGLIQSLRTAAPQLQIIAISGGGRTKNFDLLRMARKLGANEGIRKPFSSETILAAVNTCIAARNGYDQQRASSSPPALAGGQSGDE